MGVNDRQPDLSHELANPAGRGPANPAINPTIHPGIEAPGEHYFNQLSGELDNVETQEDEIFGVHVPTSVPGVPSEVLIPRNAWQDKDAYDRQARDLASRFTKNFAQYADQVDAEIREAGPKA